MTMKRHDKGRPAASGLSRRELVVAGGAALAAGVALSPGSQAAAPRRRLRSRLPLERPNLVILVTDQERLPQYRPDGWVAEHLPNRVRLAAHGLTFTRAFCNAAMCSPSRATLFTGLYPAEHRVKEVLQVGAETDGTEYHLTQATLHPDTPNMARMLADAGNEVQYRGKWHVSKDPSGTVAVQSRRDLDRRARVAW
jgi:choline-sulfatase